MIHWGWLIVANIAGAVFGAFIMAILAAGAWSDMKLKHFIETQHLRDEIRHMKDALVETGTTTNG